MNITLDSTAPKSFHSKNVFVTKNSDLGLPKSVFYCNGCMMQKLLTKENYIMPDTMVSSAIMLYFLTSNFLTLKDCRY